MPTGTSSFDALAPTSIVIRWCSLLTLVIIVGSITFRLFIASTPRSREMEASDTPLSATLRSRAAQLGLWTTVVFGATTLARFATQWVILDKPAISLMLWHTTWGVAWLVQAGAGILTALGFVGALHPSEGRPVAWTLATTGALILAATPALSGHAVATPGIPVLAVVSDWGHVLGAGGWLGSLFVLAVIGLPAVRLVEPAHRGATTAHFVNRFSDIALVCATLTLVTGAVSAWLHLGTLAALWQTTYGRTLVVKLGVLSLVLATGAYNWRIVRPSLDRSGEAGILHLSRSATLELIIGAAVIAITAILIGTPTPGT